MMSRILKWIIFPFMTLDRSLFLGGFVITQRLVLLDLVTSLAVSSEIPVWDSFSLKPPKPTCVRMLFSTKGLDLHDKYTNSLGGFVPFTSKRKSLRHYCRVCQHGVIKITEWTCSHNILLNTRRIRQNGGKA